MYDPTFGVSDLVKCDPFLEGSAQTCATKATGISTNLFVDMSWHGAKIVEATVGPRTIDLTLRVGDRVSKHHLTQWAVHSHGQVFRGDGMVAKRAAVEDDWSDERAAQDALDAELAPIVPFVVSDETLLLTVMPLMARWGEEHRPTEASHRRLTDAVRQLRDAKVLYFDMRRTNTLVDDRGNVRFCDVAELYPPRRMLAVIARATVDGPTRDQLHRRVGDPALIERCWSADVCVSLVPSDLRAVVQVWPCARYLVVTPLAFGAFVGVSHVATLEDADGALAAMWAVWRLLTAWALYQIAAQDANVTASRSTWARVPRALETSASPLARAALAAHRAVARLAQDPTDPTPFDELVAK
jgi:hypothetical protein